MKKQFVPYSIALALKELGFNEPCMKHVQGNTFDVNSTSVNECVPVLAENFNAKTDCVSLPLWQQVEQWFREKHYLFINVLGDGLNGTLKGFYYSITEDGWINWYESVDDSKWYDDYEKAREAAVLEAIKLLKGEK